MSIRDVFEPEPPAEAIRELAKQVDQLGNAIQSAADTIAKALRDAAQPSQQQP
jgi:prefoldin subunit 5